jgi:hypothetical protein
LLTDAQRAAFNVVHATLRGGRKLLFESETAALPIRMSDAVSADDTIPQFGFVGKYYGARKIAVIGINPGNGPDDHRTQSDEEMMPVLHRFVAEPNEVTYAAASFAQAKAFPSWLASKEIGLILEGEGIRADEIAYTNACPYRAGKGESKDVFPNNRRMRLAADNWLSPLLNALTPKLVIAHGQKAAEVISYCALSSTRLVYNRSRNQRVRSAKNIVFVSNLRAALLHETPQS